MFYYVSGTVAEIEAGLAVIDCGGVGYCSSACPAWGPERRWRSCRP